MHFSNSDNKETAGQDPRRRAATGSALRPTASQMEEGTALAARRAALVALQALRMTTLAATVQLRRGGCSGSPTLSSQTTRARGVGQDQKMSPGPVRPLQRQTEDRTEGLNRALTTRARHSALTTLLNLKLPTTMTTAIKSSNAPHRLVPFDAEKTLHIVFIF